MESSSELWRQFNLAEQNPSPGGGILTCLRCSREEIEERHPGIVSAIQDMGVDLKDIDTGIAVIPQNPFSEENAIKLMALLGQLSVLNEALEYYDVGFGVFNNIAELKNGIVSAVLQLLTERKLVDAYDLVDRVVPQIVRDIRITNRQENVLSPDEIGDLDALDRFAQTKVRQLNKPTVMLG